mmetsp:Transcript_25691/g.65205  ORF Transcript_25691/g.65205 Transcript_25691/m.65205 type:complete len:202 (+) Transcript_25691:65-670(+)
MFAEQEREHRIDNSQVLAPAQFTDFARLPRSLRASASPSICGCCAAGAAIAAWSTPSMATRSRAVPALIHTRPFEPTATSNGTTAPTSASSSPPAASSTARLRATPRETATTAPPLSSPKSDWPVIQSLDVTPAGAAQHSSGSISLCASTTRANTSEPTCRFGLFLRVAPSKASAGSVDSEEAPRSTRYSSEPFSTTTPIT